MDPEEYFEERTWQDSMDVEDVVRYGLEEEDDMNAEDAAYLRGFIDESNQHKRNEREMAHTDMFDFEETRAVET